MNALKKKRMKTVMKYTWPIYIVTGFIVFIALNFIFSFTHRLPAYKTLTLFISGEVKNDQKLKSDLLYQYQDNELKNVSIISSKPTNPYYLNKLTVAGYASADVLIIPTSTLEDLTLNAFALDLDAELVSSLYQGFTLYKQEDKDYGVKLDKSKIEQYMTLPDEDCYLFLNAASKNLGEYSYKPVKEHNNALNVVKNWGM